MIRRATSADIERFCETRNIVRENRLSDPSKVTIADVRRFIISPGRTLSLRCRAWSNTESFHKRCLFVIAQACKYPVADFIPFFRTNFKIVIHDVQIILDDKK